MRYLGIDVSLCNGLLLQSYSLLWKRVRTIRRPAAAPFVLPRERVQRYHCTRLHGVTSHSNIHIRDYLLFGLFSHRTQRFGDWLCPRLQVVR
jgi:hypothetical protein